MKTFLVTEHCENRGLRKKYNMSNFTFAYCVKALQLDTDDIDAFVDG